MPCGCIAGKSRSQPFLGTSGWDHSFSIAGYVVSSLECNICSAIFLISCFHLVFVWQFKMPNSVFVSNLGLHKYWRFRIMNCRTRFLAELMGPKTWCERWGSLFPRAAFLLLAEFGGFHTQRQSMRTWKTTSSDKGKCEKQLNVFASFVCLRFTRKVRSTQKWLLKRRFFSVFPFNHLTEALTLNLRTL